MRQSSISQTHMPRTEMSQPDTLKPDKPRFEHRKSRRVALLLLGLAFVLAVWPLGILGLSGGIWQEAGRTAYVETFRAMHAAVSLPPEGMP